VGDVLKRIEKWRDELRRKDGESMLANLVVWDERLWLRKPNGTWPEILAYRLGGSWLNVAEVVPGADVIGATTLSCDPLPVSSDPLIRVGQDCTPADLIERDLDAAIASELVFSVWIRRRDAHPWNRVYVAGVPICSTSRSPSGRKPTTGRYKASLS
jgi:hypothetical protein